MKALITGGCGFVGRHLTELLLSAGHEVQSLGLGVASGETPHHECDVRDFDALVSFLRAAAPDRVVHLAAWSSVGSSFKNPSRAFEVNAQGTVNVLEAVRSLGLKCRVLVVSSGEVYGAPETDGPVDEESPVAPVSPYGLGKACAELSSLYYSSVGGVDLVTIRAFNHTGPGQTDVFALPGFARQIAEAEVGLGEPVLKVGNLDVVRDFTDVRDVVRAYRLLLEGDPPCGLYNVCSGRGYRLESLVERLVSLSRIPVDVRVDRRRQRRAEIPVLVGDNGRIARDTGWRPEIPIETTITDVLEYWRGKVGAG